VRPSLGYRSADGGGRCWPPSALSAREGSHCGGLVSASSLHQFTPFWCISSPYRFLITLPYDARHRLPHPFRSYFPFDLGQRRCVLATRQPTPPLPHSNFR